MRGNFVLLIADTMRLLLPQHEVGAAEYLDGPLEPAEQPGLLKLQGKTSQKRFAALSTRMTLLPNCPPDRFVVVSLGNDALGWCWNGLQVLHNAVLQPRTLPPVLQAPGAPVSHYVEIDGKPAYCCNAHQVRLFALASKG